MADPLNGVYKARQSSRFAAGRSPFGPQDGGRLDLRPSAARADHGVLDAGRGPSVWRPDEIGSLVALPGALAA